MNKNKAAAMIEGPEDVLNSKEENNPNICLLYTSDAADE